MSGRFRRISAPASADLSAVFVSDGADEKPGIATLIGDMGADALRFPAVLVPEGAEPPGYPFVEFGEIRAAGEPGPSSGRTPTAERGLRAHRSSTHARSHARPARQEAARVSAAEPDASGDARLATPAGAPPAMARVSRGQLHDYAADAIGAALHALAVPPAYNSLSELVHLAVAGDWSAGLPRLP